MLSQSLLTISSCVFNIFYIVKHVILLDNIYNIILNFSQIMNMVRANRHRSYPNELV